MSLSRTIPLLAILPVIGGCQPPNENQKGLDNQNSPRAGALLSIDFPDGYEGLYECSGVRRFDVSGEMNFSPGGHLPRIAYIDFSPAGTVKVSREIQGDIRPNQTEIDWGEGRVYSPEEMIDFVDIGNENKRYQQRFDGKILCFSCAF